MEGPRAFAEVDGRLVFYRRFGIGPVVLVLHGSPQSSRAVIPTAQAIAAKGLCAIVPDTPGNGRSEPLTSATPQIPDYAQALAGFADALGLGRVGLHGFHTGAAIACAFAALYPDRTAAVVLDGLPDWTATERDGMVATYLPPFKPAWDGSHMAWLWARLEEQTVFFPWDTATPATRMYYDVSVPEHIHGNALDLLNAGDGYRAPYRAAFQFEAGAWSGRIAAPCRLLATADDVLVPHLQRPGLVGLKGEVVADAVALREAAAAHLAAHPGDVPSRPFPQHERGFVQTAGGAIAYRARLAGSGPARVLLHQPGGSKDDLSARFDALEGPVIALDMPGHGDSSEGWDVYPKDRAEWLATAGEVALQLTGNAELDADWLVGFDVDVATADLGDLSLRPAWDGAHLVRAWRIARWEALFDPWHKRDRAHAKVPFGDLDPAVVQARAVGLIKAHDRWLAVARAFSPQA